MSQVEVIKYNAPTTGQREAKLKWWDAKPAEIFGDINSAVDRIDQNQAYRAEGNLHHARLYSNKEFIALNAWRYGKVTTKLPAANNNQVKFNVARACVHTAQAKIAKNKPRPIFLPEEGNWAQRRRAQNRAEYISGVFKETNLYRLGQDAFKDGCIYGTGLVKFYPTDEGRIGADRVNVDEIKVDDVEAVYGCPRSMFQVRLMHREVLAEQFRGKVKDADGKTVDIDELLAAANAGKDAAATQESASDMVRVIEAWHLKSGKNAKDGVHAIVVSNATLFHETWSKSRFPFAVFRWTRPTLGWYGDGLIAEVAPIQVEINKLLADIQITHHLVTVPRVWVQGQKPTITNQIGGVHYYLGEKPIFETPPGLPPEIYQHLDRLVTRAFEMSGVSEMSASAKKHPGIESGVAIREMSDIETERFVIVGQDYETFYLDAAEIVTELSSDMAKNATAVSVLVGGRKATQKLKWSDVYEENDDLVMDAFPTSFLPSEPGGRLQKVKELEESGYIPKEYALALLDFPDVGAYTSLQTAGLELIHKLLEDMLYKGQARSPDPLLDLQLTFQVAHTSYLQAKMDGAPEKNLDLVRNFIARTADLLKQATQTQQVAALPQPTQEPAQLPAPAPAPTLPA